MTVFQSPAPPVFSYQDPRERRSPLAPAVLWVVGEVSCMLRTGDTQTVHNKERGDSTWRAVSLPRHEVLEESSWQPCLVPGPMTGLGRPCSNMGDALEIQSWKPEEQPKLAPGITRGFKFFFSPIAAISLCRAQSCRHGVHSQALTFLLLQQKKFSLTAL